jgi:lipopolysaccharide biosynthesis regulator YciM
MLELLLLLLPLAVFGGWLMGRRHEKLHVQDEASGQTLQASYFQGLNYLINEEPDKAVDVFIKMLEVNSDTVETHLALGNLFRRKGEVERAIRIHQNLIARPQLSNAQRKQAMLELAQDYLRAGVLDRAEKLFLEVIEFGGDRSVSLRNLIHIYQLQKEWQQAINMAKQLEVVNKVSMAKTIAHYCCELAEQACENDAKRYLKGALEYDENCARASIILGKVLFKEKKYDEAIAAFKRVEYQDESYVSEIIDLLYQSHLQSNRSDEFVTYVGQHIKDNPRSCYVLAMVDCIYHDCGAAEALKYLAEQMPHCLSLRALGKMLDLYLNHPDIELPMQWPILKEFLEKLLANGSAYRCFHCGFSGKILYWQCPSCRRWGSVKPV